MAGRTRARSGDHRRGCRAVGHVGLDADVDIQPARADAQLAGAGHDIHDRGDDDHDPAPVLPGRRAGGGRSEHRLGDARDRHRPQPARRLRTGRPRRRHRRRLRTARPGARVRRSRPGGPAAGGPSQRHAARPRVGVSQLRLPTWALRGPSRSGRRGAGGRRHREARPQRAPARHRRRRAEPGSRRSHDRFRRDAGRTVGRAARPRVRLRDQLPGRRPRPHVLRVRAVAPTLRRPRNRRRHPRVRPVAARVDDRRRRPSGRVTPESQGQRRDAPPSADGYRQPVRRIAVTVALATSLVVDACGSGAECGTLEVPVDYDDPDGDTLSLSIARMPAEGDRIGPLFVNPGGPGGTATDFAVGLSSSLPREISEHFDIVGVDPRGLGASDIDCGGDFAELYGVDYTIDSPEDTSTLLEVSSDYIDGCDVAAGDLLPHLGTENVARDIDAVRAAMGDEQLNYLGFSYGTAIGQVLAEQFPDRVRSMVIDGVLELGPTGTDLAVTQAQGFESAFAAFADDCDADPSCPAGPDATAALDELTARVEAAPVAASPRDLGPGELSTGLAMPLYSQSLWPDLAQAIADGLDGEGSGMVSLADEYLGVADFDISFAVNCLDFDWPETPDELLAAGAAAAGAAPHFGPAIVNDYVRCAMWPVEEEPLPAVTAPDAPPIVVVSTTNDPATPYEAGVRTAERLETGVLVSYEGEGHGVVGGDSPCVDDAVARYLVDLEPPEDGITC